MEFKTDPVRLIFSTNSGFTKHAKEAIQLKHAIPFFIKLVLLEFIVISEAIKKDFTTLKFLTSDH
jgi:hypothetical protein